MRLLLDTHALIWFTEGASGISVVARRALEDSANTVFYSCVNVWEIAIKLSLKKLTMSMHLEDEFAAFLFRNGLLELPVQHMHVARTAYMPMHHRDPFDRLLIAQAELEQLTVVSKDPEFDAYGIKRLW